MTRNLSLIILILLWTLTSLPGAVSRPFSSNGEPREALSSQYMINTGNWLIAKRYGEEIQTKPPFSHWVASVVSLPFGKVTELSARASALIFSLIVLVTYFLFLGKYVDQKIAFFTVLLLLLSPEWLRASQTTRVDMTLAGGEVLGGLFLFQYFKNHFLVTRYLLFSCLFLSIAFLTKGPVGLVLPLGIYGIFLLTQKISWKVIITQCLLISIASSILPLSWYLAVYLQEGREFLDLVFLENFKRLNSSIDVDSFGIDPHQHSAFYLYGTLMIGFLPFSPYMIFNIHRLLNKEALKTYREQLKSNQIYLYFFISSLISIIFFSIPSSKRSVYLLPIYPYLAFFLALAFNFLKNSSISQKLDRIWVFGLSLIGTVVVLFLLIDFNGLTNYVTLSPRKLIELNFYQQVLIDLCSNFIYPVFFALLIFNYLIIKLLKHFYQIEIRMSLFLYYLASLIIINSFLVPGVTKSLSAKSLGTKITATIKKDIPIYTYNFKDYELNFYIDGKLQEINSFDELPVESYLIIKEIDIQENGVKIPTDIFSEKIFSEYLSFKWKSKEYSLFYFQKNLKQS